MAFEEELVALVREMKGDVRKSLNTCEAAANYGKITVTNVDRATGAYVRRGVKEVLNLALRGDFKSAVAKMNEIVDQEGVSGEDFMKYANEVILSSHPESAEIAEVTGLSEYRIHEGAHTKLELSAYLAKLSKMASPA